jgi:putative transposase
MAGKRFTPEQIISMLRESEGRLSQGENVKGICRGLGITEQTYYRWRKDYGGMKVSQARRRRNLSERMVV